MRLKITALIPFFLAVTVAAQSHIRVNQAGYLSGQSKVALAFSTQPIEGSFEIINLAAKQTVFEGKAEPLGNFKDWGGRYFYRLDFSGWQESGRYIIRLTEDKTESLQFKIAENAYADLPDSMLMFMRQQRCGYNPFLDMVCHQRDGRSFYGPMPDSSFVDVSGGWHDAGDQLKYLITSSNATARMLLAYAHNPSIFGDRVNALGQPGANGLPDILDEARWGLEWLFKVHTAGSLVHQVADDRDHIGWKWPDRDSSDYGWGPNSYRAAYFATGTPQGLSQYKSAATGIANLAGRCAAAMAIAARIWPGDSLFALRCRDEAIALYKLGKQNPGYQQGNSYKAPYRYNEDTWADDMEWAAAELYRLTGNENYMRDAKEYARAIAATSWMQRDSSDHYRLYPFSNLGHYALYPQVDEALQKELAGYYRENIENMRTRAGQNPFGVGTTFIWCSNNLTTALITQIALYEKMTGDRSYRDLMLQHLDWLWGRNPWGTSMFTGLPADGEFPEDVHTSVWALTGRVVPGGLVDGPVRKSIYNSLRGLTLTQPDEFAAFQFGPIVYHDDIGDYSTNEPTMDGTADAIFMMSLMNALK